MWFTRLSLAALAAASSQLALASPASSVLQFEGAVKGTTCTVSVGGVEAPNPATVILQSVQLEDVKNLRGGGGKFDIDLKNCPGVLTRVRLIFQAANSGTVSGYASEFLDNMAASDPAKNVALGLLADRGGNRWEYVRIDGKTLFPDSDIYIFRKEEEKVKFETVYLIPHGKDKEEATAGNFEAAMQFTVLYQ